MLSNYKNMKLNEWQRMNKPLNEIIVATSNMTGSDKSADLIFLLVCSGGFLN